MTKCNVKESRATAQFLSSGLVSSSNSSYEWIKYELLTDTVRDELVKPAEHLAAKKTKVFLRNMAPNKC